jgi:hypothetical protein
MTIERIFEMPRVWTFAMPKVRKWVEERLEGDVLNLFGGVTRLTHPHSQADGAGPDIDYNDINPDVPADLRLDACNPDLWASMGASYDTVIFDPPFSVHQAVVSYGMKKKQKVTIARDTVDYVLRPGGRVISLGFNSTGMGANRGFVKESILLINHGGSHNDTIVVCERRV